VRAHVRAAPGHHAAGAPGLGGCRDAAPLLEVGPGRLVRGGGDPDADPGPVQPVHHGGANVCVLRAGDRRGPALRQEDTGAGGGPDGLDRDRRSRPSVIRAAILVVSSKIAEGQEEDKGKAALVQLVESIPASLASYDVVPDERQAIRDRLVSPCDGGTGVRPTDVVPEVTREVAEKEIPGIGEAMRLESLKKVQTAMLSRGTAGIRGWTLIVNLPGSPRGARENLAVVLPVLEHTVDKVQGR